MNQKPQILTLPDREIAYQQRKAKQGQEQKYGVVFLSGFASDMTGSKATFLDEQCEKAGYAYLRFDYTGHGDSSGVFKEGCIGDWFDDALEAIDKLTTGPQVLVGSSMGGWIALLLARARPERVAGLVGIAAAPDFTEDLIRPAMTPQQNKDLLEKGFFYEKDESEVEEGYDQLPITRKLMDDGAKHNVLRDPLRIDTPVHLLQGKLDKEVPWKTAQKIADHIGGGNVEVTLVDEGDHRLSRPEDLVRVWGVIRGMVG